MDSVDVEGRKRPDTQDLFRIFSHNNEVENWNGTGENIVTTSYDIISVHLWCRSSSHTIDETK